MKKPTNQRLPYPTSTLDRPVRKFEDTFRLSDAIKKAITLNKK